MRVADIRFLFDYDAWGTRRVLTQAEGCDESLWSGANMIGERGLGGILVHTLGAHMRWRHGWEAAGGPRPRPETQQLPTPFALLRAWEREWAELDRYLAALSAEDLGRDFDGVPLWQTMLHVVNHGTQPRSEAAALLTDAGRSPGDLDLIDFAEKRAEG